MVGRICCALVYGDEHPSPWLLSPPLPTQPTPPCPHIADISMAAVAVTVATMAGGAMDGARGLASGLPRKSLTWSHHGTRVHRMQLPQRRHVPPWPLVTPIVPQQLLLARLEVMASVCADSWDRAGELPGSVQNPGVQFDEWCERGTWGTRR